MFSCAFIEFFPYRFWHFHYVLLCITSDHELFVAFISDLAHDFLLSHIFLDVVLQFNNGGCPHGVCHPHSHFVLYYLCLWIYLISAVHVVKIEQFLLFRFLDIFDHTLNLNGILDIVISQIFLKHLQSIYIPKIVLLFLFEGLMIVLYVVLYRLELMLYFFLIFVY